MLPKKHPDQMNRRERRIAEANERQQAALAEKMPPARADGRPMYYDIPVGDRALCYHCVRNGINVQHNHGRIVQNDPANPPPGRPKGEMFTICVHHLPDNAVIYNPTNNLCRNKAGDHTWEEAPRQDIPDTLRNVQ